jgi:arabinan endo-1,5-alpha-L-arabinosidase
MTISRRKRCMRAGGVALRVCNAGRLRRPRAGGGNGADANASAGDAHDAGSPPRPVPCPPPSPSPTFGPRSIRDQGGDTYYVFGSHLAAAKSTDLMNWTKLADGVTNANPLFNGSANVTPSWPTPSPGRR